MHACIRWRTEEEASEAFASGGNLEGGKIESENKSEHFFLAPHNGNGAKLLALRAALWRFT